jgi:hypothetical protein
MGKGRTKSPGAEWAGPSATESHDYQENSAYWSGHKAVIMT